MCVCFFFLSALRCRLFSCHKGAANTKSKESWSYLLHSWQLLCSIQLYTTSWVCMFFLFFFYLETLVPNLEEAVPGPCRHCHAVVGHAQAAHPVVVTRQDTCREATGWEAVWWRLPYVQGALWNLQTRTCDTYHRWTAPPCASTAGVAPNRRRRSQSVRATSIQRCLKLLIVKISPGFMSSVWYLDTAAKMRACSNPYSSIQSIPVKYSCLGGGLVGLLHRVCRWHSLSWIHTAGFFF